jgi:hypothetical protein
MNGRWAAVLFFCTAPLLSGAVPKFNVEKVTTETADLPAGGTLRIEGSYGELNIEAWDELQVRMVATVSSWVSDTQADRDRVNKQLNQIHIASERQGNDVVIRTPRHSPFHRDYQLDYRIFVPRAARLFIRHDIGDVVIRGVTGAIDASIKAGDLLLLLDGASSYSFDAYTHAGRVNSDFGGNWHRHHFLAEAYTTGAAGNASPVKLHAGFGGIDIRKVQTVPLPS